jgi:hypothetical protein
MARRKLVRVPALDKGKTRLSGLKSIDPNLDLSNGLTVVAYEKEINLLEKKVDTYNTTLSTIDDLYNEYAVQLSVVKDLNERMLDGVSSKFNKNSSQYEMAGGVRKADRKKPVKKTLSNPK